MKKMNKNTMTPIRLAKFIHNVYEREAVNLGWKTQRSCRNKKFHELPLENQQLMVFVANEIIKKFQSFGKGHEIVAIENNEEIAKIYQKFFPNDKVIVTDAHKFLLEHFNEFDFIWASPPCPSHSRARKSNPKQNKPIFPNLKLYEEILFLMGYFKGKWVVENVISWYDPLIKPKEIGHHYFWTNYPLSKKQFAKRGISQVGETLQTLQKRRFDLSHIDSSKVDKRLVLRNCVEPELGLHIFEMAFHKPQLRLDEGIFIRKKKKDGGV